MDTKEKVVLSVKDWLKIDNEIIVLKKELKTKTDSKKQITNNLMNIMKTDNIDCFSINGGSLVYKKNVVNKPITSKVLHTTLQKYCKVNGDIKIAEELTKYILDNREKIEKETIHRKIDK